MSLFEDHEVAINTVLFKTLGIFHILDPSLLKSTNIFNYNFYRFIIVVLIAIVLFINCFGLLGFVIKKYDIVNELVLLQTINGHIMYFQCILKLSIFVYNADKFWDILDVTRINFLINKSCYKHVKILYTCRDKLIKTTNLIAVMVNITLFMWLIVPILSYITWPDDDHRRYDSIINMWFPVSTHIYNEYYFIFFIMEATVAIFTGYVLTIFDVFSISISYILMCQYEVITLALKNFGHELDYQNSKYVEM